jgi:hypothetical protein
MRIAVVFCFILMMFSCKQDSKINLPELKEGYYEFELLEKYVYPPDSTGYLAEAVHSAQIYSNPGFLIKKSLKENSFSACVTYYDYIYNPGCNPFNCSLEIIYHSIDSIYFQKPPCKIYGSRSGFIPHGQWGPAAFVDSTFKYQPHIIGLKLSKNSNLEGFWSEIIQCRYITHGKDAEFTIDSIVDRPIFAKFKLKFVKGI